MSAWRVGFWNGRGGHMQVFRYTDEHKNRMGCCDWLPKDGDLCLRVEDAGDCFHTYIALRQREDGKYERAGKFGAYIFGEAICKLDERTFYLACAGEPIDMPNPAVRGDRKAGVPCTGVVGSLNHREKQDEPARL